jgi:hypothetical protein
MRLKNSTDFADTFIRRMVSWICKRIELSPRSIKDIRVTTCKRAYRGRAFPWTRSVLLRIGPASSFPVNEFRYCGNLVNAIDDRIEGLVAITAHELWHIVQAGKVHGRALEAGAVWAGNKAVIAFREQRETLLAQWSEVSTREPVQKPSIQEQRAAKLSASLLRWQRKKKLAETKIKKLKKRLYYYERVQAAMKASGPCE